MRFFPASFCFTLKKSTFYSPFTLYFSSATFLQKFDQKPLYIIYILKNKSFYRKYSKKRSKSPQTRINTAFFCYKSGFKNVAKLHFFVAKRHFLQFFLIFLLLFLHTKNSIFHKIFQKRSKNLINFSIIFYKFPQKSHRLLPYITVSHVNIFIIYDK